MPVAHENDLKLLAAQFIDKMKGGFQAADQYIEKRQPEDQKLLKLFESIPDDETLILTLRLNKLGLAREIIAIKKGDDILVSLADFVTAADFAITVDQVDKVAKGWFVREDQPFILNIPAGTVQVKNQTYALAPADVDTDSGEIMVKGRTLSHWFDAQFLTNVSQQVLTVKSEQKWPPQEKHDRAERAKKGGLYKAKPPSLPLQEDAYEAVSIPAADVYLERRHARPAGAPPENTQKHVMTSVGDVGFHTNKTVLTGNIEHNVSNIRTTFSRNSAEPDLLGPLKARFYEFGDVSTVNVPYAAPAAGEMGFRVSNKDPFSTFNTQTQIQGDSVPGWDIELYREDQYIGLVTVGDDGRYTFDNVDLYAGDNVFRIVQFGPQGEVREEEKRVSVSPNVYGAGGDAYEVSVSSQNTQTYTKSPSNDIDRRTPRIAGSYEKQVTPNIAVQGGFQSLQQAGEDKFYVQSGAVASVGKSILNAYHVIDDDGAWKAVGAVRRNIGKHNLSASASYHTENFDPVNNDTVLATYDWNVSARGPLPNIPGTRNTTYSADHSYLEASNGISVGRTTVGMSTRVDKLTFSNSVYNQVARYIDGETKESTDGAFSVRGSAWGLGWRAVAGYELYPDKKIDQYLLELKKGLGPRLSGTLSFMNLPETDFNQVDASVTWAGDHVMLTPTMSYDSDNNVTATLKARFGLVANPYTKDVYMRGQNLTAKGSLSARVFLDQDGDGLYGDGDELLEGATVEAVHVRKYAETDKNGEAFIHDLPEGVLTDVVVQDGSMFDPNWVSGRAGISVRPRAGHTSRVDFPIHKGSELDGTLYAANRFGNPLPLKNVNLGLFSIDGTLVKKATTAYDGFYLMERIPPGSYVLVVDAKDAKNARVSRPRPQYLSFSYKGDTVYGHNIILDADDGTDYIVIVDPEKAYGKMYPDFDLTTLKGRKFVMNLGSYKSNLLMGVVWYKANHLYRFAMNNTQKITSLIHAVPDSDTGTFDLRVLPPLQETYEAVRERCRMLVAHEIPCKVEILPPGMADKVVNLPAATTKLAHTVQEH